MSKKKLIVFFSGLAVVLVIMVLMFITADQPGFGRLLGYSGPDVSGGGVIAYMQINGTNQGAIPGDANVSGRDKTHAVFAIDHTIEIPADTITGLPTGQRIHRPFVVTTHVSPGTPKLNQMCVSGEPGTVEIFYYRKNALGQNEHYYTVRLDQSIIMNISHYKPLAFLPENEAFGDMVTISFHYSEITWTHEIDGIVTSDNWRK